MFAYLASPYTHDDPAVREQRFEAVCAAAGRLMADGVIVYSPIAHSHPIAKTMDVSPVDHDFWLRQCLGILRHADRIIVLQLDGWAASRGIAAEITYAQQVGIPVEYLAP